jgi:hypothetical protein
VAGCCECGDESSGSCATELVSIIIQQSLFGVPYVCFCATVFESITLYAYLDLLIHHCKFIKIVQRVI